jgi:hypothetical protein
MNLCRELLEWDEWEYAGGWHLELLGELRMFWWMGNGEKHAHSSFIFRN